MLDASGLTPYELDEVRLLSLGVDVGSATTQFLFSHLVLRRLPGSLSSRFALAERAVRYRSPIHLTPYRSGTLIDDERVRELVVRAFTAAGIERAEVDTGAVVVTGEAAGRINAQSVAEALAATAGDFVCVVAGHHLEAVLAAYGSGAVEASRRAGSRVLCIDVGGGTTKFAVVASGIVEQTGALHVGGRLAAFEAGRIVLLEPVCERIAVAAGLHWSAGASVGDVAIRRVSSLMADAIVAAACGEPLPFDDDGSALWLTPPISAGQYDTVIFSGGVAEYIDGNGAAGVNDLGRTLGAALSTRSVRLPGPVAAGAQRIGSTVIGASQFTVQLSGNTVYVSDPDALPVRNVRAIRIVVPNGDVVDAAGVAGQIERNVRLLEMNASDPFATMIEWHGMATFPRLNVLVAGLAAALIRQAEQGRPVWLAFDADIARIAGRMLNRMPGFERVPIVSVDGLDLAAFDYVDIGRIGPSGTVPITIKSLLFEC